MRARDGLRLATRFFELRNTPRDSPARSRRKTAFECAASASSAAYKSRAKACVASRSGSEASSDSLKLCAGRRVAGKSGSLTNGDRGSRRSQTSSASSHSRSSMDQPPTGPEIIEAESDKAGRRLTGASKYPAPWSASAAAPLRGPGTGGHRHLAGQQLPALRRHRRGRNDCVAEVATVSDFASLAGAIRRALRSRRRARLIRTA